MLSDEQLNRYSRQAIMSEIGEEGQERLLSAKIAIIGAGGLGCPLGLYLAGAGIGSIDIIDNDIIELSNLNRQIAFTLKDIKKSKAISLSRSMLEINPNISVKAINERLSLSNIDNHINNIDLVVDCTDNFEIRHLLAKKCFDEKIPMSFGAAVRQEGQTAFFQAGKKDINSSKLLPCYACIFPEKPNQSLISRCSEAGILGPTTGIIASIQALNIIRYFTNQKVSENLIILDGASFLEIKIKKSNSCYICK